MTYERPYIFQEKCCIEIWCNALISHIAADEESKREKGCLMLC